MRRQALIASFAVLSLVVAPTAASGQYVTRGGVAIRMLSHQALVRSALGELLPPERRVSQWGLGLILPTFWPAMHIEGRVLRGERGSIDLRSVDAGVVLGWRSLGLAAAFGQRGSYDPQTGLAHGREAEFSRLGLRLATGDPDAMFTLHLRGDAYLPIQKMEDSADALSGWDAEGGVTWRTRRLPLTASLGYRLERFQIFRVQQEVSALTVALGLAFGGR